MEICRLIRIDFDNMENNGDRTRTEVAVFTPSATRSAFGNASAYVASLQPMQLYAGYDHGIYPQFKFELSYTTEVAP